MDSLNYGRMMQKALRRFVAEVLAQVAEQGLPGDHHFYITFRTTHPDVEMPDWLRARYPEELVIVLQHMYFDLAVDGDHFTVTLTFNDQPAALSVPFDAVLQFADPSAEFGLRFDSPDDDEADGADGDETAASSLAERVRRGATAATAESADGDAVDAKTGEVVQLDRFRKK